MALTKFTASTAIIAALADLPNATSGLTAAQLKAKFDENPEALKVFVNNLIDQLEATTDGSSGADQIGATAISGLTGANVQSLLEAIKAYTDDLSASITTERLLSPTGNFTGTLNGQPIVETDPGLSSIVAGLEVAQAKRANEKNIFAEIVDMHYQTLRGVGFHASESDDLNLSKTITAAAVKGARAVTINNVSDLYQGQLIVLFSNDEYYTNVISSISGLIVNLAYPLEVAISINDTLHNFYINSTHPNMYGAKAIADTALRNLIKPTGECLYKRILPTDFTFSGTGSVGDGGFVQDYTEPFSTFDTKVLTISSGQNELATNVLYLERDMYLKFRTYVTIGTGATLNFQISNTNDSIAYYNKEKTAEGIGKSDVIEVVTYLRKGNYNFKLQNTTPGSIALGKTEIYELSSKHDLSDFDRGVHVCLGDSWFVNDYQYYLTNRLRERLPNATIHDYGVGGNEVDNLIRRFTGTATNADINNDLVHYGDGRIDATTIPVIDYVWVMCGTNNYSTGTSSSDFKDEMDDLMKEIIDRGAKPLIFTSSVGEVGVSTRFTLSREYADLYYNDVDTDGFKQGTWIPVLAGLTTPGSNTYATQTGTYYKIGKMVVCQFNVKLSAKDGAMAGAVLLQGLPFTPATGYFGVSFGQVENVAIGGTTYTQYGGYASGSSGIILTKMAGTTGSWDNILPAIIANNSAFRGSVTYLTD